MMFVDDLYEVVHGFFKEPIIGSLKYKLAKIRHLENRHDVIFFCRGWSDLDKIWQTGVEWHHDCGDMAEIETRSRIPIWQTFGQIQWYVISEPPATLQCAATWQIQCHDPRAMCDIAGCCHRANSLSWFQSHMPHCRVQSPGEINIMIAPHCTTNQSNSIRYIKNRFSAIFCFLNAVWALTSCGFRIVSDTLVQ